MIPMIVGTALALAALAYVLYPLLRSASSVHSVRALVSSSADPDKATAVDALREIEFDYATGKLSDSDYAALKSSYVAKAVTELRDGARPSSCPACGATPEADAIFCSRCGRLLA